MDFHGVKVALLFEDKLVMQLRDDKPGLFNANMWDFPGGGREVGESPFECITREVEEEFGITLNQESIIWEKIYPSQKDPNQKALFMVAKISKADVDSIKFGIEGQRWDFFEVKDFFDDEQVIESLKGRFRDYLDAK